MTFLSDASMEREFRLPIKYLLLKVAHLRNNDGKTDKTVKLYSKFCSKIYLLAQSNVLNSISYENIFIRINFTSRSTNNP